MGAVVEKNGQGGEAVKGRKKRWQGKTSGMKKV